MLRLNECLYFLQEKNNKQKHQKGSQKRSGRKNDIQTKKCVRVCELLVKSMSNEQP